MGGKKKGGKSKKGKKGSKSKAPKDTEPKVENPLFKNHLPFFGWIRVTLRLCDPPLKQFNYFTVIMRANHGVMELKKHIVNYHGRVETISLYNFDPYPPREKPPNDKKNLKPIVPPFRDLDKLVKLKEEKEAIDAKAAALAKKKEEEAKQPGATATNMFAAPEEEKKSSELAPGEDPRRFDILQKYEFPTNDFMGESKYIICYDELDITLQEISNSYGSKWKPTTNPENDPKPPEEVEEEEVEEEQPGSPDPKEGEEEEGEGDDADPDGEPIADAGDDDGAGLIPKEEKEVFVPATDVVIWYDFDAYNGRDPILLA